MTDTTRPGEAEAIEVALEVALSDWERSRVAGSRRSISRAITKAYPVIAAAVREQVAQEIEAMPLNHDGPDPKHRAPLDAETVRRNAARITRGVR